MMVTEITDGICKKGRIMLSSTHRVLRRAYPRAVTVPVRLRSEYKGRSSRQPRRQQRATKKPKRTTIAELDNDWISGRDHLDQTKYETVTALNSSKGTLSSNKPLHDLVEEVLFTFTRNMARDQLKHISPTESQQLHTKAAHKMFEHDLSRSLSSFTTPTKITLADLLLPTAQNLPSLLTALQSQNDTVTRFFTAKNIPEKFDQAYYLLEQAYNHRLNTISAHRTPAQNLNVDISNPAEWFPAARRLKRHLILHVGPTNSGKTYNALKRLKESKNGVYAGPLRLLAREVYNRFKSEGLRCNLITGEEVVPDLDEFGTEASLSCSTVEMVNVNDEFEVAVIDEIQMIAESSRGWAWTNALLGVRAKEVHLCGEASVVPLIKKLAVMTGDKVTVKEYTRLGTLKVEDSPVRGGLSGLKKGDCIVVFSKKRILAYKADIESKTKLRVGVIYGALPAETRTEQAKKFNDGDYDVLVASDAIGMGLNLRIKRVIFDTHQKFDGKKRIDIPIPHVKQIGGRAGRYKVAPSGSKGANTIDDTTNAADEGVGYVSAFYSETLPYIKECMAHETIMLNKASLWPNDEVMSQYIAQFPTDVPKTDIIRKFKEEVNKVALFNIGSEEDILEMLNVLENVKGMLVVDLLRISTAPLSTRLPLFRNVLFDFARNVSDNDTKACFDFQSLNFSVLHKTTHNMEDLNDLEELHKYLMVWLWMNNRYPSLFVNRESANDVKDLIEDKIEDVLSGMKFQRIG